MYAHRMLAELRWHQGLQDEETLAHLLRVLEALLLLLVSTAAAATE
jgi:hypothetical protein